MTNQRIKGCIRATTEATMMGLWISIFLCFLWIMFVSNLNDSILNASLIVFGFIGGFSMSVAAVFLISHNMWIDRWKRMLRGDSKNGD